MFIFNFYVWICVLCFCVSYMRFYKIYVDILLYILLMVHLKTYSILRVNKMTHNNYLINNNFPPQRNTAKRAPHEKKPDHQKNFNKGNILHILRFLNWMIDDTGNDGEKVFSLHFVAYGCVGFYVRVYFNVCPNNDCFAKFSSFSSVHVI